MPNEKTLKDFCVLQYVIDRNIFVKLTHNGLGRAVVGIFEIYQPATAAQYFLKVEVNN